MSKNSLLDNMKLIGISECVPPYGVGRTARGKFEIPPEFFDPLPDEILDVFQKNEYELIEFFKTKHEKSEKKGDSNG